MPTKNNPFEHIITPTNIPSAWPPAPIYWFIAGMTIIIILLVIYLLKRYIKKQKIIKQALTSLQTQQQNSVSFSQLNQLLKGVALQYYPRTQVASLTGIDWFIFLQKHAEETIFNNQDEFCQRLYQQQSACTEADFDAAKKWIIAFPKKVKALQKPLSVAKNSAGKQNV